MAHIPPLRPTVTQRFQEVHLGKAAENEADKKNFENYSGITSRDEAHHVSGTTTQTLSEYETAATAAAGNWGFNGLNHILPQPVRNYTQFINNLKDIGDFKRTLVHKKSEQALSLLEDPHKELKDFGKTHEHTSLEGRLLGDGGFPPLAQFMGGEDEAAEFATRILKRAYEQDLSARLGSGRWGDLDEEAKEEEYDSKEFIKEMAQKQAEDVVSSYLGDHEEEGTLVG
jgi:hypothetical protein